MFSLRDQLRFMLQIKLYHCVCVAGKEDVQEKGKSSAKLSRIPYLSYLLNPSKRNGSRRAR